MRQGRHLKIAIGSSCFAVPSGPVAAITEAGPLTPFPLPVGDDGPGRAEGVGEVGGEPVLQHAPPGTSGSGGHLLLYAVADGGLVGLRVDRALGLVDDAAAAALPPLDVAAVMGRPLAAAVGRVTAPPADGGRRAGGGIPLLLATAAGRTVGIPAAEVRGVAAVERVYAAPGGGPLLAVVEGRLRPARALGDGDGGAAWAVVPAADAAAPVLLVDRATALTVADPAAVCVAAAGDGAPRAWWVAPDDVLVEILAATPLEPAAASRPYGMAPAGPPPTPALLVRSGRHRLLVPAAWVRRTALSPDASLPFTGRRDPRHRIPMIDLRRLLDGDAAPSARRLVVLAPAGAPAGMAGLAVLADDAALVSVPVGARRTVSAPPPVACLFDAVAADPEAPGWRFCVRPGITFTGLPAGIRRRVARSIIGWLADGEPPGDGAHPAPADTRVPEPA